MATVRKSQLDLAIESIDNDIAAVRTRAEGDVEALELAKKRLLKQQTDAADRKRERGEAAGRRSTTTGN
jgi:hypothetical protein